VRAQVVRVPEGAGVHEFLEKYITEHGLKGGLVLGIGGLKHAVIGYLDLATRQYRVVELESSETALEVASLLGNYFARPDGTIRIHVHVVVGTPSGSHAGHLISGVVYPFLEVFLVELGEGVAAKLGQK